MRSPRAIAPELAFLPRGIATVSLLAAFGACGGKATVFVPDSGSGTRSEGGASTMQDAQACVVVDLSTYDQSCDQDSDCVSVESGPVCDGYFAFCDTQGCGGATIRASEQPRYQRAISAVSPAPLPYDCPLCQNPVCLDHTCTLFQDGGTVAENDADDSDDEGDASDGGACVNVDLTGYDVSCTTNSDCISVTSGDICPGSCACGGSTISQSGEAQYEAQYGAAISRIPLGTCGCPLSGIPECVGGTCVVCGPLFGLPACPDGG